MTYKKGVVYFDDKSFKAAIAEFKQAHSSPYAILSEIFFDRDALENLHKTHKLNPYNAFYCRKLAEKYIENLAYDYASKGLVVDSKLYSIYICQYAADNIEAALNHIFKVFDKTTMLLEALGWAYLKLGNSQEALHF